MRGRLLLLLALLVMKNPEPDGWTETLDAAEARGPMKRVVISRFRKR